jgi:major outer membrane protein
MIGTARRLLVATTLSVAVTGPAARGQATSPIPTPPGEPNFSPPAAPAPGYGPAPGYQPPAFSRLEADPLLEEPGSPPSGWFATAEATLTNVHLKNGLFDFVTVSPNQTDLVHVPGAGLDWTAAPRIEVGYRMPRGFGEWLIAYHFIATSGAADMVGDQGTAHLTSRFDANAIDFVYANRDYPLAPGWEMRWKVGVELASFYYDTRVNLAPASGVLAQDASDRFIGAGPMAGLELSRQLSVPGLSLYGQVEGASIWERIRQTFGETITSAGGDATPLIGLVRDVRTQGSGVVRAQAGLSWSPSPSNATRFFLGYSWEGWFQALRNDVTGSFGDFYANGIFFRGEIHF